LADGILLERAGIPSVSVCTTAFRPTADAMARNLGFPGYQYVTLQHPIAPLTEQEIAALVKDAIQDILRVLGAGLTYQEATG
jgi:hypothetical protein